MGAPPESDRLVLDARPRHVPEPAGSGPRRRDRSVLSAVAHVRWRSVADQARRGQRLDLWATLSAANYRYIMRYSFHDDGTIQARVAGTSQNLRSVPVGDETGMHVHQAAWRMEFDLGAPGA